MQHCGSARAANEQTRGKSRERGRIGLMIAHECACTIASSIQSKVCAREWEIWNESEWRRRGKLTQIIRFCTAPSAHTLLLYLFPFIFISTIPLSSSMCGAAATFPVPAFAAAAISPLCTFVRLTSLQSLWESFVFAIRQS